MSDSDDVSQPDEQLTRERQDKRKVTAQDGAWKECKSAYMLGTEPTPGVTERRAEAKQSPN